MVSELDGRQRRVPAPLLALGLALLAIALLPEVAWAWTPGTHVFLGEAVMRALPQLPGPVAELLRAFPYDFLYGSIAADTSIAKKYVPVGRHCHSWAVGLEIYERARDERLRAFSLGYLAHLAADSIAHNYFVPRQLAVTSSTAGLGHSYWESRFEMHLGEGHSRRARELILLDQSHADGHLDRILSPTIFSTQTNRRLFRGMVRVTDTDSWQRIFMVVKENSRWDLPDAAVGRYMERSYDYVMDFLIRLDRSEPYLLDPSGDAQLRLSKKVRRDAKGRGDEALVDEAERQFGMPAATLDYASSLPEPLYPPTRAASS